MWEGEEGLGGERGWWEGEGLVVSPCVVWLLRAKVIDVSNLQLLSGHGGHYIKR